MTKTQQKLVKTIRRLHQRGEPLNIAAVKHRHPELMEAVYAVKPFWGWKKALEDAGLDYADIKVELQDLCTCEICGVQRMILAPHLKHKHGIDKDEYRIDYPGAEVVCEAIRARRSKMKCKDPPHWERLWTAEYVLDRLWQRRGKGLPLNHYAVYQHDDMLARQTIFCFGSFDNALGRLGLNPKEIRRKPESLMTKKEVLDGIARRRRRHLPLYPDTVRFGHKDSDGVLYGGAVRLFGSWRKAIEAAGLNYAETRKTKYPTPESVVREIKRRYRLGLSLSTKKLQRGEHYDGPLYCQGVRYFDAWEKAIEAAGLDYEKIAMDRSKYPTPESVIREIKRRYRAGLPINLKGILLGKRRKAGLYAQACKFFRTWKKAVQAAGICYSDIIICRRKYRTKESVITEIQRRQKAGLSIRSTAITMGSQADVGLYNNARRYFGQWVKAVKHAGFSYWDMYPKSVYHAPPESSR